MNLLAHAYAMTSSPSWQFTVRILVCSSAMSCLEAILGNEKSVQYQCEVQDLHFQFIHLLPPF